MMQKIKNFMRSPASTALLFFLAALLLLGSTVGSARAALTYYSENYTSRVELEHMGVSILENGEVISENSSEPTEIFADLLGDDSAFAVGKKYADEITVKNSGDIDGFVRVIVYRYWVDEGEDEKRLDLDPELIKISVPNLGKGWILDTSASTKERLVYYYDTVLAAGQNTAVFSDGIQVDSAVNTFVTETRETKGEFTTITRTYLYDGTEFRIEIEADVVQAHNAQAAIKSAWGRSVTVNGSTLSLAEEG